MPQFREDRQLRDAMSLAGPAGMVVLVYEEIIRALETAIDAIQAGDIPVRLRSVNRAMDLLDHLYECLDEERGGEIARNLGALYRFIMSRLTMVNPRNDPEPARQAILLVRPLLSSWQHLARKERQNRPSSSSPADDHVVDARALA